MGLQSFESGLERMVDGVFSRGSRPALRPVEIGRRLLREVDEHRSVDVKGRRIVPNQFVVAVSQRDLDSFEPYFDHLCDELALTVREYARSEGYYFMGAVAVEIRLDQSQRPGRFTVGSAIKESSSGAGAGSLVLPSGDRLKLGRDTFTVGRQGDCTLPVTDTNASRRHCEIRPSGTSWVVADLGSTNGTKVNGLRIQGEHQLKDQDIISVGNTHLRFEAS
jgi:hypothetical protein